MLAARSLALAATVLVTIGGCRGGASGPKITLRYHPPAGAAYHYALDQQNAMRIEGGPMSAMPEQTFRMRMYYTQLVKGPMQGGVAVTVTFDSTSLDAPGMGPGAMRPALDRMRGMRSDILYDDRMHVLSAAFTQRGEGGAPQTGTLRLSGNLSGEQLYSLQRSAQVCAMMGGTIKMKSGAAGQPEMTMAMTQQTSLQLTEAK